MLDVTLLRQVTEKISDSWCVTPSETIIPGRFKNREEITQLIALCPNLPSLVRLVNLMDRISAEEAFFPAAYQI